GDVLVLEGMLKAAHSARYDGQLREQPTSVILQAALRWRRDNQPPAPTGDVPEGIEDLLWDESLEPGSKLTFADVNKDLIESYRRAQLDAAENLCGPVTDEEWIENRII